MNKKGFGIKFCLTYLFYNTAASLSLKNKVKKMMEHTDLGEEQGLLLPFFNALNNTEM